MAFSLIPKDESYFKDFEEGIAAVRKITRSLVAGFSGPTLAIDLHASVKAAEVEIDQVTKRTLGRLDTSFVTPIEREDIHLLAINIDDVADSIEVATSRLNLYRVEAATDELREMARVLDEMVGCLEDGIRALRTLDTAGVRGAIARVDNLEEKHDNLYRSALRGLFDRRPEAYDLVRWKEIYDMVEDAADHCRHVGRTLAHILVRHS